MQKTRLAVATCMICHRYITTQFSVCAECEGRYLDNKPKRDWPDWAKRLYADHRAQERREARQMANEVDLLYALGVHELNCYGEFTGHV